MQEIISKRILLLIPISKPILANTKYFFSLYYLYILLYFVILFSSYYHGLKLLLFTHIYLTGSFVKGLHFQLTENVFKRRCGFVVVVAVAPCMHRHRTLYEHLYAFWYIILYIFIYLSINASISY